VYQEIIIEQIAAQQAKSAQKLRKHSFYGAN
jgi:hypothetical protein